MASLRKRLQNLFSTNVVVRKYGKDRLKIVDTNRLQSTGNLSQTRLADRYSRLHGSRKHAGGSYGGYDSNHYAQQNRMQLYTDYEMMDKDPIISSALDIYSDESSLADQFGEILTIKTNKTPIQKILHNLYYDILNIDFNMWPWIRNLCKYGDFYLKLDIADGLGIMSARPFSAYEIERLEEFDEETGEYNIKFRHSYTELNEYEVFEIAHFRMISDSNFLPYGRSMLEGARQEFQKLMMLEDAMLIHRIMRAPEKRIFKIDIGNIPPNEVDSFMETIINKMKKVPYIDKNTGNYNLKFNLNNMLEDYYLPVRGGNSQTQIDTLPGMQFTGIDDIEYVKNKMMAALKIPKPFLGFDEGVEGKTTLASMDIRFARTIERIQKIVVSELVKIGIIHLYSQGYEGEDLVGFELELTAPSIIYDQQKVALMNEKIQLATSMKDSKLLSDKYIYEFIFNMSEDQWLEERNNVVEDLKLRFRQNQIEQEGNDPTITGVSYGTPHDMASLHMSSDDVEDKDKGGRPPEGLKYGQHNNEFGWDPTGAKTIKQGTNPKNFDTTFKPEPRMRGKVTKATAMENASIIKNLTSKKSKILTETDKNINNSSSLLDEDNIL
jgi:hypothetical protein|tara:strand:- start:3717 stop:5540 length:1824 start_codon:yes stop_codon:yes gene_type:complete